MKDIRYYNVIEDFNDLLTHENPKEILEDLRILSLTNYENLVTIVMRTAEKEKKVAAIFKDPYFRNAGEN